MPAEIGVNPVGAARQQSQAGGCFIGQFRLWQDTAADGDNRVGGKDIGACQFGVALCGAAGNFLWRSRDTAPPAASGGNAADDIPRSPRIAIGRDFLDRGYR